MSIYMNDLMGEATALGLGACHVGVLFRLLWIQQVHGGSIPADLRELRRLAGGDVKPDVVSAVVLHFFPMTGDGRRANQQHAEAQATHSASYKAKVEGGRKGAALRWAQDRSPNGSPNRTPNANHNHSQNPEQEPKPDYGHARGEERSTPGRKTVASAKEEIGDACEFEPDDGGGVVDDIPF